MLGGEKGSVAFHGDHRPASIYVDGQVISEPSGSTQEGTMLTFDRTYNHVAEVSVFGESVQETLTGKNLLVFTSATSGDLNGISWQKNPDGSVSVRGTATATTRIDVSHKRESLKAGTYTLNSNGGNQSLYVVIYDSNGSWIDGRDINSGASSATFTLTQDLVNYSCRIYVSSGATVNATLYPQIELGSTATSYEPYCGGIPAPNPSYPMPIESRASACVETSDADGSKTSTTDLTALLDGRELRSLPDGTRDELVVHRDGRVELVQRVGRERMYSSYTNGVAQQAGEGYIVYSKEYDTPSANWGNGGRCTHFTNGDGVKGDASYRIGDGNNWVYIYTTDQDVVSNPSAWFASHEVYFDYPLATPQTIQLPSIDPLPTFHPYTFIDGNGADISAMVRIMP